MLRKPLLGWVLIALLLTQVGAGLVFADSHEDADDYLQSKLWVPAVAVSLIVHEESTDFVADNPIRFDFESSEARTMASVRFGGELMSPTFEDLPFQPRFYLSLGVLWSTPGNGLDNARDETVSRPDYRDVNLAQEVRTVERREYTAGPANLTAVASEFEGQGNRIRTRQRHNAWYAGVGSVFTFPRSGFTIRARPSLEYVGEVFSHKGQYSLVTEVNPLPPRFFIDEVKLKDRNTLHSMGPGLELELINHLDGNLTLSFFTQTHFLWVLNDPKTKLKGETFDDRPVVYTIDRKRFNFRGGAGVRLGFRNLGFSF